MNTHTMLATLESHKRACQMRRAQMLRPLPELARIYLAMHGDKEAQAAVSIGTVDMYEPAETFSRFIEVNRLPVFESCLRG